MPPRKSSDKEVQPAQAGHADDSPLHSEGENDPITFLPVSPLAERSYGNPVFKEKEADRGGDFAESSNVFRGMTERLDLAFKEQNQAMRRLVDSQTESSRRQEELVKQYQVVEQVRQSRLEIPPPVIEMLRQIQEALIPALGGQGNQPHPNIQQQNFFMGEGQRQHEPMEAAAPVADHGNQPQHRYIPPGRRGNVGLHHQPYPRDFFQPQVPPAQPVQRGLQNHLAQLFNRDQLIDLVQETYGPALRPLVRPAYRKPYLDIIDHENPFSRGFKVPEFTLFSGEVGQSTIEHIGRFTIQCGEASGDDNLKLRLFPSFLTGTALTWYLSLPQNSVYSWRQMEDLFHTQFYRCEPEVSMADLSRLAQKPGESSEAFLARFRRARLKCRVALPEQEFVKLAQNGLDIEFRKKFEGMEFRDFYELSYKVALYENLLKEDVQKKAASHGTYYSNPNFDLDVAEVVTDKPVVCPDLVRPTHQPETSVRCYVGEAGKQYTFDVSKASDIFDHLKKSDKAKETMGVDADPFPAVFVGVNVADLRSVARNRSLPYAQRNLAAEDLSRVLVDNGAAVNVLPTCMLYKIGKSLDDLVHTEVTISDFTGGVNHSRGVLPVELTVGNRTLMSVFFVVDTVATYNALLGSDWIHSSWCVPSSLHQKLIFWNGGKAEVVSADDKPFSANTHLVEARYYEDIGTIRFFGMDRHGKPIGITACSRPSLSKCAVEEEREKAVLEITKKLAAYFAEKVVQVDRSEIVHEAEAQDPLEEINLGSESEPKVTFISDSLEPQTRDQIVRLLHEFKDCFAWDYSEMPGLDRKLVEHKLPIAEGFRPYKQPPRRMSVEVTLKVKEEIERLCVDFRNLNLATPKDEYPMPIADLLVDGVAHADVPKTAFRCPGVVGTFEWVVMPFGLKNAGATYQRAMNAIFHDMIGKFMEIYIDDVVVKSNGEADHLVHLRKSFERMRQHGLKMNPLKCAFGVSACNFLGYLVHERSLEVDKNKARAVIEAKPPQNKKELQRFLGQVNFLRRFISNLAGKTRVFSPLLKLKSEADFK
ncbi:hypothetical protein SLEP1_g59025 [Rubroshorea leprosula]|uniref:Uncharacterized protein n=1 Tax=Rubroshorea leprosula TaxID=152421 RepID=A0AAV5MR45_9ROSI|nr:hypothetical protein SLEP1_g59025 [Rubroshorea leprosula]